ncbi:MAG TPA: RagB/SusD family nutrient uptake outer membrane protein [Flavisolibacter sp.]|nr:RagB/SusD family nutrient uptake outer membrane protein [Flavisolibacter sp.]
MKKYYLYRYILMPALMICMFTSCKKYINEAPITSTYDSKFWTSQTSVNQATLALYKQLRDCFRDQGIDYNYNSYFIFGDLTSGMFLPASREWNYATITTDRQYDFSYVPYLEGALKNWSRFYKLIAQANLILERVPQMPTSLFNNDEKIKNSYIAEALFMRAYVYFYITRVWGDPVYISRTYNSSDYGNIEPVARTAEATVLDSCISDLKKAAGMMDYSHGDPTRAIRANKGSANALMAHIYAWKHDYVNAHLACQEVINNGGYSLEPAASYKNIWAGQSSSESIFELAMQFNENGNEENFDFFQTFLKDNYIDNRLSNCWVASKDYIEYLYDQQNDIRFQNILTHVNASGGDKEGYLMLKYTGFKYKTPATEAGPYINNNLVLFRLADIYLLDAEALAMQDNASAVTPLNIVKQRAGLDPYSGPLDKVSLCNEILEERGRELIGEGQWFYDMIRTEPVTHALEDWLGYPSDRVAQKGYYWPIDMSALFKTDPLLTQNPWWASH